MRMKIMPKMLCVLMAVATLTTSCLKDKDSTNTGTYSDVAITYLTLGTLNRYTQTTSAYTGNDTVVKTTFAGSAYPMTIDHLGQSIYNKKELPVGTDVAHVVLSTVTAKNNGMVALQRATSDSLSWLTTTDSIDFTTPRVLWVYSSDGTARRTYTVTLNVSPNTGIDFAWKKMADIAGVSLADSRLVAFGDTVRLVSRGVVTRGDRAFRLGDDGLVETSTDLEQWTREQDATYDNADLKCLIGTGSTELFAMGNDGKLKKSAHASGAVWQDESLDEDEQLLPDADWALVSWPYAPVDSTDYVLMVGSNSRLADGKASVWRKISQYGGNTKGGRWVYMPSDDINRFQLPALTRPSLVCYEGVVLCVGSDMVVRQSRDQGITWQTSGVYALPSTLQTQQVSMAADTKNRLWLLTAEGELWQGARR